MAKFMLLGGSPRKHGNTEKMLDIFQKAMAEQLPGVEFERYFLEEMHIQMCRACLTCFKTGECVFQDKVNEMVASLEKCDGLILASPVYYGSMTAQLKAVLDRIGLIAEAHDRSLRGKIGGSITVARRWGHLATQAELMLWFDRVEMVHVGCGWCSATSTNANNIDTDEEGLHYPVRLAENIARLIHN